MVSLPTCTHFGSAGGSLCAVVGPCPGEMRRHSLGRQMGPRGLEPWAAERPLASLVLEGNRLRLMSLQCMVGNYACCNENNKAGSIVVSKNTANAECLLGAFVCHLWVSVLRLARRQEPRSAVSHPSGGGFGLAGELRPLCSVSAASRAGQVLAWEVRWELPGCIWESLVSPPTAHSCAITCCGVIGRCARQPCWELGTLVCGCSHVPVTCPHVPWQVPACWPARRRDGRDWGSCPGGVVCVSPALRGQGRARWGQGCLCGVSWHKQDSDCGILLLSG